MALRENPKMCKNFKHWKIMDLLSDIKFSKLVFALTRQTRSYIYEHNSMILSRTRSREDEIQINFPTDTPTFFKGIG